MVKDGDPRINVFGGPVVAKSVESFVYEELAKKNGTHLNSGEKQ